MNQEIKKNKAGESDLPYMLITGGIFTIVLLLVDIFYKGMGELISSWVTYPFFILHLVALVLWVIVIKNIEDPNYDKYRKLLFGILIAALLLVLGHRSGLMSKTMFNEEVEKNKKEQSAN